MSLFSARLYIYMYMCAFGTGGSRTLSLSIEPSQLVETTTREIPPFEKYTLLSVWFEWYFLVGYGSLFQ